MIASLAEQVSGPVSTNTRSKFNAGNGWPARTENPWVVERNGTALPAGCLLLNWGTSKTMPAVGPGPAIM